MCKEKILNNAKQGASGKARRLRYLLPAICYMLFVMSCLVYAPNSETTPIPDGMGRVTLNLNGVSARMILPASNALQLNQFVSYQLIFEDTSGGVVYDEKLTLASGDSTFAPIDLVPGTYGLTVNAYKAGDLLAARGQVGGIDVDDGDDTEVDVVLRAVMDSGVGSFLWDVTLNTAPITLTSATMTIIGGASDIVKPLAFNGQTTGTEVDLAAGVYTVRFNLAGSDTTSPRAVVWNELMYVYATLTSNFENEFTYNYFHRTHWNVIYDQNYTSSPAAGTQSVVHGGKAPESTPTRDDYNLEGWFTKNGTGDDWGDEWDFDDPIHDDMTLYAQWKLIVGTATVKLETETIAAVFTFTTDPVMPGDVIEVSRNPAAGNHEVEVEVTGLFVNGTAVTLGDYTFNWLVLGVGEHSTTNTTGTGPTFTLNGATTSYNTLGGHILRLTATPTAGGDSYQRNIRFTITTN